MFWKKEKKKSVHALSPQLVDNRLSAMYRKLRGAESQTVHSFQGSFLIWHSACSLPWGFHRGLLLKHEGNMPVCGKRRVRQFIQIRVQIPKFLTWSIWAHNLKSFHFLVGFFFAPTYYLFYSSCCLNTHFSASILMSQHRLHLCTLLPQPLSSSHCRIQQATVQLGHWWGGLAPHQACYQQLRCRNKKNENEVTATEASLFKCWLKNVSALTNHLFDVLSLNSEYNSTHSKASYIISLREVFQFIGNQRILEMCTSNAHCIWLIWRVHCKYTLNTSVSHNALRAAAAPAFVFLFFFLDSYTGRTHVYWQHRN